MPSKAGSCRAQFLEIQLPHCGMGEGCTDRLGNVEPRALVGCQLRLGDDEEGGTGWSPLLAVGAHVRCVAGREKPCEASICQLQIKAPQDRRVMNVVLSSNPCTAIADYSETAEVDSSDPILA